MPADPPPEIAALGERRAAARAAKDFATADAVREQLRATGWDVTDGPTGFTLVPIEPPADARPLPPGEVRSVLSEPAVFDVALHWVCEGWPEDLDRAIAAFRETSAGRRLQFVVADVTGAARDRWGDGVEVVSLVDGTGWAAARNAGLRRSLAPVVLALDGSLEPTGDALTPLLAALEDPEVGIVGPYGIVTTDLREFEPATGPGPCDAVEGYLMAFRRDTLATVGGFDERFRWYRTADIEWSFRVKDAGFRCEVVEAPTVRHEHRMWTAADPESRTAWSKRNFYRFLDRWRDRWDLVLAGSPGGTDPSAAVSPPGSGAPGE